MKTLFRWCVVTVVAGALAAPGAVLAAPGTNAGGERIDFDDTGPSELLTAECGFPVTEHVTGHARLRVDPPDGSGLLFHGTFAVTVVLTGDESGNTVVFRDRGTDLMREFDDGTVELAVVGRALPFGTIGRLVLVFDEDFEVVDTRFAGREIDFAAICAQLAP